MLLGIILVTIVLEILIIIPLTCIIIKITYPIFDDHFDENFLRDYKEIIDDIIKGRKSD